MTKLASDIKDTLSEVNFTSNLLSSNNDFESVSAKTEDSLLNTRSNSETASFVKGGDGCCRKKRGSCGTCCCFSTGLILCSIGILSFIWSPFYILMRARLDMLPGLPPFEWWRDPPQEVRLRAYVFNVTNSEEFLSGADTKMKMAEVGPIVYLEKLTHKNVHFNNNDTLTYTVNRSAIFLPDENQIDLNSTIIVPNYAVLGMASYLSEASFFMRMGFNVILRGLQTPMFIKTTIYDFLWNFTDPILSLGRTLEPEMVPDLNIGMLHVIYRDFEDNATVFIGQKNDNEKFFELNNFAGSEYIPGHGPDSKCQDLIVNSTEGALYPQFITKNSTLRYWRKTMCKVIDLYFDSEQYSEKYTVQTYKFVKGKKVYDRLSNQTADCYKGNPALPSGLFDVSKCYSGISMAASYPHYLYGSDEVLGYVEGMNPNETLHNSFVYVEPLTGIPVESIARSQSNMIVKDTTTFNSQLQKFSNMAVPMFWIEYHQIGLPYYVKNLIIFTVKLVPTYQYYFVSFLLLLGVYCLVDTFKSIFGKSTKLNYERNANIHFEQETFLTKSNM